MKKVNEYEFVGYFFKDYTDDKPIDIIKLYNEVSSTVDNLKIVIGETCELEQQSFGEKSVSYEYLAAITKDPKDLEELKICFLGQYNGANFELVYKSIDNIVSLQTVDKYLNLEDLTKKKDEELVVPKL